MKALKFSTLWQIVNSVLAFSSFLPRWMLNSLIILSRISESRFACETLLKPQFSHIKRHPPLVLTLQWILLRANFLIEIGVFGNARFYPLGFEKIPSLSTFTSVWITFWGPTLDKKGYFRFSFCIHLTWTVSFISKIDFRRIRFEARSSTNVWKIGIGSKTVLFYSCTKSSNLQIKGRFENL